MIILSILFVASLIIGIVFIAKSLILYLNKIGSGKSKTQEEIDRMKITDFRIKLAIGSAKNIVRLAEYF